MNIQQILKLSRLNRWIFSLPEEKQAEAEFIHDQWLQISKETVKNRHNNLRLIRKKIEDWKNSSEMKEFAKKSRLRYLKSCKNEAVCDFNKLRGQYIQLIRLKATEGEKMACAKKAEGISKKIRGYENSINIIKGKKGLKNIITNDMIERAKEYPIERIIEVGINKRAKCPWHNGEDYNADIRNNFLYCYVCGVSADSIGVHRQVHQSSFVEAVTSLQ